VSRIERRFAELRRQGRAGLVTYLTAGDPDLDTSLRLFTDLAAAGADLVEIGMPFSDPMADGPVIQKAGQRALKQDMTLSRTLALVGELRRTDDTTPIVLMGYYNPIYRYGPERFARDAVAVGVDGVIVVDLPPEEDAAVVGTALVQRLALNLNPDDTAKAGLVNAVLADVRALAAGVRAAR